MQYHIYYMNIEQRVTFFINSNLNWFINYIQHTEQILRAVLEYSKTYLERLTDTTKI